MGRGVTLERLVLILCLVRQVHCASPVGWTSNAGSTASFQIVARKHDRGSVTLTKALRIHAIPSAECRDQGSEAPCAAEALALRLMNYRRHQPRFRSAGGSPSAPIRIGLINGSGGGGSGSAFPKPVSFAGVGD
jgi:hypothetical protein